MQPTWTSPTHPGTVLFYVNASTTTASEPSWSAAWPWQCAPPPGAPNCEWQTSPQHLAPQPFAAGPYSHQWGQQPQQPPPQNGPAFSYGLGSNDQTLHSPTQPPLTTTSNEQAAVVPSYHSAPLPSAPPSSAVQALLDSILRERIGRPLTSAEQEESQPDRKRARLVTLAVGSVSSGAMQAAPSPSVLATSSLTAESTGPALEPAEPSQPTSQATPSVPKKEKRPASIPQVSASFCLADFLRHVNPSPKQFSTDSIATGARFFVIKSFGAANVHKSFKYGVWSSTGRGNHVLDRAWRAQQKRAEEEKRRPDPVYLIFSVNGSHVFCGVAEMRSSVEFDARFDGWSDPNWSGRFDVSWLFVKEIALSRVRHLRLANANVSVAKARDTEELPRTAAGSILQMFSHAHSGFGDIIARFAQFDAEEALQRRRTRPPLSITLSSRARR